LLPFDALRKGNAPERAEDGVSSADESARGATIVCIVGLGLGVVPVRIRSGLIENAGEGGGCSWPGTESVAAVVGVVDLAGSEPVCGMLD
jgi:hypothetical protein